MLPFDEAGTGPAIVLLHAGIADRTMWGEHLGPLAAAGHRVIAPDLPGFGEAVPRPGGPAPWTETIELLGALGIDRAVLVGSSFGGAVALRVAVVAPERVAGLMLVSAPPIDLDPSPRLAAAWEAEESALEAGDIDAAVQVVVRAWTLPDGPPAVRERVARMQRRAFELQLSLPDYEQEAPDPFDADSSAVKRVDVPALVAAGERDMPDFLDAAQQLARDLPCSGRAVVIAGAGHLAPLETPEAFRKLLAGFAEEPDTLPPA